MTPPRTQTPPLRVLNGGAQPTSGVETVEVISPELALVDPELATRARASLRTYDGDELVAGVQPTSHANGIAPAPSGDEETMLSPELALVDPELADRARAQLADAEPASPAAPVGQPEQPPQSLRPSRVAPRAARVEPVEPTRRAWSKGSVIAAVIVLAAGLGGPLPSGLGTTTAPRAREEWSRPRFSRCASGRRRLPLAGAAKRRQRDHRSKAWPVRKTADLRRGHAGKE